MTFRFQTGARIPFQMVDLENLSHDERNASVLIKQNISNTSGRTKQTPAAILVEGMEHYSQETCIPGSKLAQSFIIIVDVVKAEYFEECRKR